ncbi:MAG: class I SAM-dependent methyltransferase [Verrucomicrobia bacterium]|nr:class I SAM-dependent methyltransferase [Verrucomicrobiota bacterium]
MKRRDPYPTTRTRMRSTLGRAVTPRPFDFDVFRDTMQTAFVDLVPLAPKGRWRFLDLGAGDGRLLRLLLEHFPNARATYFDLRTMPGLDTAPERMLKPMLDRVTFVTGDFSRPGWERALPHDYHVIFSSEAIHHLLDRAKARLYRELPGLLVPGGLLLNGEGFKHESPRWAERYYRIRLDEIARQRRAGKLDAKKARLWMDWARERYEKTYIEPDRTFTDQFASLDHTLRWLRKAGFKDAAILWQWLDHAIVGAFAPAP